MPNTHNIFTDYLTDLLLLGFLLRRHIIAMTIQTNITQTVIRALVVAATMMINVRLASSVSSLTVGAPTVVDDSTTTNVLEVTDADVIFKVLLSLEVLFTVDGAEETGTAAEVATLLVEGVELDTSLLDAVLEGNAILLDVSAIVRLTVLLETVEEGIELDTSLLDAVLEEGNGVLLDVSATVVSI